MFVINTTSYILALITDVDVGLFLTYRIHQVVFTIETKWCERCIAMLSLRSGGPRASRRLRGEALLYEQQAEASDEQEE